MIRVGGGRASQETGIKEIDRSIVCQVMAGRRPGAGAVTYFLTPEA
ncbi:Protein of unknown function [Propionibacterium freudenreichii]|nr:Protein of unknown function [Propionibacterium freudenreichii]